MDINACMSSLSFNLAVGMNPHYALTTSSKQLTNMTHFSLICIIIAYVRA